MGTVTDVGFGLVWDFPVLVRERNFDNKRIEGPRAALKYLEQNFSIKNGHQYQTAVLACRSALRRRCDLQVARVFFIAAYAEYMLRAGHS